MKKTAVVLMSLIMVMCYMPMMALRKLPQIVMADPVVATKLQSVQRIMIRYLRLY